MPRRSDSRSRRCPASKAPRCRRARRQDRARFTLTMSSPMFPALRRYHADMNAYDVTPEFFSVLGIRLLEGRTFQVGDAADATIIARSLAAKLWPGQSAIGRTMSFMKRSFRIVGVTGDILNRSNDPRLDEPEIYLPLLAAPSAGSSTPALTASSMYLIVRCRESCPPLETLRAGVQAAGARSTVGRGMRIATESDWSGLERPRSAAVVAVAFAAIGLIAVGGGLFAVARPGRPAAAARVWHPGGAWRDAWRSAPPGFHQRPVRSRRRAGCGGCGRVALSRERWRRFSIKSRWATRPLGRSWCSRSRSWSWPPPGVRRGGRHASIPWACCERNQYRGIRRVNPPNSVFSVILRDLRVMSRRSFSEAVRCFADSPPDKRTVCADSARARRCSSR